MWWYLKCNLRIVLFHFDTTLDSQETNERICSHAH